MSACVPDFSEPVRMPELPPITGAGMLQAARKMRKQVAGLDGISPSRLVLLPLVQAHARLGQMLVAFGQQASWPESVCHWKIVMLPKQGKASCPNLKN